MSFEDAENNSCDQRNSSVIAEVNLNLPNE